MRSTALRANRESQRLSQARKTPVNILLKKNEKDQKNERNAAKKTTSKLTTAKSAM